MRLICSKFAGKCAKCGGRYEQGASVWYDGNAPKGKKALHQECRGESPAPERIAQPRQIKGETYRAHFDSVAQFRALQPDASNQRLWAYTVGEIPEWRFGGARNLDGYTKRMEAGWAEGAEKLSALACRDAPIPTDVRRRPTRADQGDEYDIHSAWRGQLDRAWTRRVRQTALAPRRITIVAMVAGACGQSEEQFFWRGAAATRLADALCAAGHAVQIVVACVSGRVVGNTPMAYSITLKPFEQPLDVSSVAGVLCQVGFHRYEFFKAMASLPGCNGHFGWNDDDELLGLAKLVADDYGRDTYVLPYDTDTDLKAGRWIDRTLDQIEGAELLAA